MKRSMRGLLGASLGMATVAGVAPIIAGAAAVSAAAAVRTGNVTASPRPASVTPRLGPVVISKNETLKSDLLCTTLVIDPKVVLTTDGWGIYCSLSVNNEGTIETGPSTDKSFPLSYGGSGAGASGTSASTGTGRATRVAGGKPCTAKSCAAGNGATPVAPKPTDASLNSWHRAGMNLYLAGAQGGSSGVETGGAGGNGLAIRTGSLTAGKIVANGFAGKIASGGTTAGGGGGGGTVVLEYDTSYKPGSYSVTGGVDRIGSKSVDAGGHGSVVVVKGPPFAPPTVIVQPKNTSLLAGKTATFTSTAAGNPAPSVIWQIFTGYTWVNLVNGKQQDGSTISGATTDKLTIADVQPDENGAEYWAVFTNAEGSIPSAGAKLTVWQVPKVTQQPTSQTANAGGSASFTAAASGNPTPSVVWQYLSGSNWINIGSTLPGGSDASGAGTGTLSITNANTADNGLQLWAEFSNSQGTVVSGVVKLTVNAALSAPQMTQQPTSQTANAGGSASFTAAASGNPTPSVVWQYDTGSGWSDITGGMLPGGSTVTGVNSDTLNVTNANTADNGIQLWAKYSNSQGIVDSNSVTLTVTAASSPPTVTQSPSSTSVSAGSTASFTAAATGTPTPTVLWQVEASGGSTWTPLSDGTLSDGSTISGSTTNTLSIKIATGDENGNSYRALYSNTGGSTPSSAATLTIPMSAPVVEIQPNSDVVVSGQGADTSLTSVAAGSPDVPTVQWQISSTGTGGWSDLSNGLQTDGSTLSGVTTFTLTIDNWQHNEYYRAVFTNNEGTATSNDSFVWW
jgi:hypothetical protein